MTDNVVVMRSDCPLQCGAFTILQHGYGWGLIRCECGNLFYYEADRDGPSVTCSACGVAQE